VVTASPAAAHIRARRIEVAPKKRWGILCKAICEGAKAGGRDARERRCVPDKE
jgi:hypothetical protein